MYRRPELDLAGNFRAALSLFAAGSAALFLFPQIEGAIFHTILDTSIVLTSAILAMLLWDRSLRINDPFMRLVALAFLAVTICEAVHALSAVEALAGFVEASPAEVRWRAGTWGPTTHVLPLALGAILLMSEQARRKTWQFGTSLALVTVAVSLLFQFLPRYVDTGLWISRPFLILSPILWLAVGYGFYRRREQDDVSYALMCMAAILALANVAMLFSHAPNDAVAMIAHWGKIVGRLYLLMCLVQMSAADMLRLVGAESALSAANRNLEARVRERTAALEAENNRRRQAEADLQKTNDELLQSQKTVLQQERLSALGQMASGIAHDINNAISPLLLHTNALIESGEAMSPRVRGYLDMVKRVTNDVAATVARMREFYREREPAAALEPVDLNEMAEQVIELTRARWSDTAQARGAFLTLHTALAPGLPPCAGIASEIREALVNLIFNAVDAMPEGGSITIATRSLGGDGPARIVLEVSDSGVGMDEATRAKCLEPFFTTKGERGTGLGLAMVYGMVQRHGGRLEIESTPGVGSTFRLVFAAADRRLPDRREDAAGTRPSRSLRILLVDDDEFILESMQLVLELEGHEVETANGGSEGVEAASRAVARGTPFDVVITDLGMPEMNGHRVAAAIKAERPETRIVLLTGWGQRMSESEDVAQSIDFVLGKPPQSDELNAVLAKCQPA
ncbi:MAG: ATP-binding protein [Rhizomicrobium sp.]